MLLTGKIAQNADPRKLFLADGFGACLTAFFLVAVLAPFEDSFGMPRTILYLLASIACMYAMYSFACYFFNVGNWPPYLKAIAIANIIYCGITAGLVVYFLENLTVLGLSYFLLEIAVIAVLVRAERMVLSRE